MPKLLNPVPPQGRGGGCGRKKCGIDPLQEGVRHRFPLLHKLQGSIKRGDCS